MVADFLPWMARDRSLVARVVFFPPKEKTSFGGGRGWLRAIEAVEMNLRMSGRLGSMADIVVEVLVLVVFSGFSC